MLFQIVIFGRSFLFLKEKVRKSSNYLTQVYRLYAPPDSLRSENETAESRRFSFLCEIKARNVFYINFTVSPASG